MAGEKVQSMQWVCKRSQYYCYNVVSCVFEFLKSKNQLKSSNNACASEIVQSQILGNEAKNSSMNGARMHCVS